MSPRNWKFRLDDILASLYRITIYVDGLDYGQWLEDQKTIDAVVRNLEIIGEAATSIPQEIQEQYPTIPWYQMKGMRNILIHEYFGIDNEVLWQTIQKDLPDLKIKISRII